MSEESDVGLDDIYASINEAIDQADIDEDVQEEDIQDEDNEIEQEDRQDDDPEISEAKEVAKKSGWVPKEEYKGDPRSWVDYEEFNRRAPLFEKISAQNKQLKSLEKKLEALANHTKTVEQKTREKVIAELKAEQRRAVADGDTDAYDEVEEKLKAVESEDLPEFEEEEKSQPDIPPAVKAFAERNDWFEKDQKMTRYMLAAVEDLVRTRKLTLDEAIEMAETEVKQVFAAKFKNPKKDKPAAVMSGNRDQRARSKSMSDLTQEQKQVWYSLKGVMTEEEFLNQLESIV